MPLTQLAPPYPIFTDKNGDPLDAGYLYFGTANQNPETNPITVYFDNALTQPAAQPIRTINGYPSRNGSPAAIYTDQYFSVTVRNKKNELVIYAPSGYGITPGTSVSFSNQITYNEGSTGAIDRTLTSRLQDYVSVKDFGAVGDGVTNDTAAIQAALDSGLNIFVPQGQFIVTDSLTMTVDGQSIYGQGIPYFGGASEIKLVSVAPKPVFITDGEGYTFRQLKITGASTAVGNIGIQIGPTSGPADHDVYINDCFINTTQDCVFSYGRGVYIENSRLVATGTCLNLNWPNPFTQTGGSDDTAETGFRAIYFRNSRLQAIAGYIVRNVGANAANLTGLTMTGNYCDGRNGVLIGGVRNGTVSANTFIGSNSIMFNLNEVRGLTITGNTFAGQFDSSGNVTTPHVADIQNIIFMNSGFSASSITFSGNTVSNVYKDVFFLNGTWSDVNITGNTFNDCLRGNNDTTLAPTQYGIVRTNTNGSGLIFTSNTTNVGNYTRNSFLVNSGGSTVSNWLVVDNTFNSTNIGEQNLGNILSASDYAVGTFTPTLTTSGTDFSSITYSTLVGGKYVKIGKVITAQVYMRTEALTVGSASGNVQIDLNNIPYGCEANTSGKADGFGAASVGAALGWTNTPIAASLRSGEKKLDLYKRSTTTSAIANLSVSDVATGTTANVIQLSVTYITD
jgi:hypothetical protein